MRTRHLLGIVLVIWIPLGYHLLADDALITDIPLLEQKYAKSPVTADNYDINLMALSESKPAPQATLDKVLNYQPPADNPFKTLRLPEIESLENLQHPLLCEFSNVSCRLDIAAQQHELSTLLAGYNGLLKQYEALQYLTDVTSGENDQVMLGIGSVVTIEHLYALHIYQLMLQGDFSEAEYKLVTLIKQQRRFLNNAMPGLKPTLTAFNFSQFYIPLALELSQRSTGLQQGLAEVLQPFSLSELISISSKQYEFVKMLAFIRQVENSAGEVEFPSLAYRLLFKPNLSANTLYQLHHLDEIAQVNSKLGWYHFTTTRKNDDSDVTGLSFKLSNYRNLVGATVISTLMPMYYSFDEQIFQIDLKLLLLQPLLQGDGYSEKLDFSSFALNPYDNSSVIYNNGQWCYVLKKDICLIDPRT